jgi:hypothetical protein
MKTFGGGNASKRQEDDFPSCLYRNDTCSMKVIIAESRKANTCLSSLPSEYPIAEDIIAIFSAIPSSILIYMSARYDSFLSSVGQITCVLAIAVASTIALHFDALRLPVRSRKI